MRPPESGAPPHPRPQPLPLPSAPTWPLVGPACGQWASGAGEGARKGRALQTHTHRRWDGQTQTHTSLTRALLSGPPSHLSAGTAGSSKVGVPLLFPPPLVVIGLHMPPGLTLCMAAPTPHQGALCHCPPSALYNALSTADWGRAGSPLWSDPNHSIAHRQKQTVGPLSFVSRFVSAWRGLRFVQEGNVV